MRTKRSAADIPENLKLCSMYIRRLRNSYKLSQQDFAKLLGTSATNICSIERGQHIPGPIIITNVARTFGVSADWLLGLSTNNTNTETLMKSEEFILNIRGEGSDILRQFPTYLNRTSRFNTYNQQTRKDILLYTTILNTGDKIFANRTDAENILKNCLENTNQKPGFLRVDR